MVTSLIEHTWTSWSSSSGSPKTQRPGELKLKFARSNTIRHFHVTSAFGGLCIYWRCFYFQVLSLVEWCTCGLDPPLCGRRVVRWTADPLHAAVWQLLPSCISFILMYVCVSECVSVLDIIMYSGNKSAHSHFFSWKHMQKHSLHSHSHCV